MEIAKRLGFSKVIHYENGKEGSSIYIIGESSARAIATLFYTGLFAHFKKFPSAKQLSLLKVI